MERDTSLQKSCVRPSHSKHSPSYSIKFNIFEIEGEMPQFKVESLLLETRKRCSVIVSLADIICEKGR